MTAEAECIILLDFGVSVHPSPTFLLLLLSFDLQCIGRAWQNQKIIHGQWTFLL